MKEHKLILEPMTPCRNEPENLNARFRYGQEMKVIRTGYANLENHGTFSYTTMTCCSDVKSTNSNWFYILPDDFDYELAKLWLAEISPIFPHFKIELVTVERDIINNLSSGIFYHPTDDVELNLPLIPERVEKYMYTTQLRSFRQRPNNLDNIFVIKNTFNAFYKSILEYLVVNIDTDINLLSIEQIVELLLEDFDKFLDNIFFNKKVGSIYIELYPRSGNYYLNLRDVLDVNRLNKNDVRSWLIKSLSVPRNIKGFLKDYNRYKELRNIRVLRANYSNKKYIIESYLAHILIRALFSSCTKDFVNQYFYIKKKCPGLYFWNLIFLTQFGFRMFYYYWLTDARIISFITPEIYQTALKDYPSTSALGFFEPWILKLTSDQTKVFSDWYAKEEFDKIIVNLNCRMQVRPTESFKKKSNNFRFQDLYKVNLIVNNHYILYGDNFIVRKYKKTNFIEVIV
jgi:hypothetical protein